MVGREILGSGKPISTTSTTDTVDTQLYEAALFIFTAGSGTLTESDSSGTGFTAVGSGDVITQKGGKPVGGAWAIAYKGSKRYLRSSAAAVVWLTNARHVPTYDSASAIAIS